MGPPDVLGGGRVLGSERVDPIIKHNLGVDVLLV